MFTLKSISKRNKSFVYNIEVKVSGETYFAEMIKQKLTTARFTKKLETNLGFNPINGVICFLLVGLSEQ